MQVVESLSGGTMAEMSAHSAQAALALEQGHVLAFPDQTFPLSEAERALIAAGASHGNTKNISFSPETRSLKGDNLAPEEQECLACMMARFGAFAETLVLAIAPGYELGLERGRTSFRPVEIAGRETSWRKDDTRLHVDAFPSTPAQGRRILRVFANVDQNGTPRRWRITPDFGAHAARFLPRLSGLHVPGAAYFMALTGITKSRRTLYDEMMLGLHDAAKRDMVWQETVAAEEVVFEPGEVWVVFTDRVFHAALSGRNALEQTFYVAPEVLAEPAEAPLAILARLAKRDERKMLT
ncbi:MAG TPA: Kdo hydroxylase family protein [Acidocella sp.]|jgi:hypothetical protein|nr:Kdo hydroxylase family protein [Acidocella sp.]